MKTYRQREKQGTKVSDSNKGPDEAKIKVSNIVIGIYFLILFCIAEMHVCLSNFC